MADWRIPVNFFIRHGMDLVQIDRWIDGKYFLSDKLGNEDFVEYHFGVISMDEYGRPRTGQVAILQKDLPEEVKQKVIEWVVRHLDEHEDSEETQAWQF
jgi:hypothetical protein